MAADLRSLTSLFVQCVKATHYPLQAPADGAPPSLRLPAELANAISEFGKYFQSLPESRRSDVRHAGSAIQIRQQKKLEWLLDQGSAVVTLCTSTGKYDALVSTIQMAILCAFNGTSSLTFSDLKSKLACSEDVLSEALLSLTAEKNPLMLRSNSSIPSYELSNWHPAGSQMVIVHRVRLVAADASSAASVAADDADHSVRTGHDFDALAHARKVLCEAESMSRDALSVSAHRVAQHHLGLADSIVDGVMTTLTLRKVDSDGFADAAAFAESNHDSAAASAASGLLPDLATWGRLAGAAPLVPVCWTAQQVEGAVLQVVEMVRVRLGVTRGQAQRLLYAAEWSSAALLDTLAFEKHWVAAGLPCIEEAAHAEGDSQTGAVKRVERSRAQFCTLLRSADAKCAMPFCDCAEEENATLKSLWCGHSFCEASWVGWIVSQVNSCPAPLAAVFCQSAGCRAMATAEFLVDLGLDHLLPRLDKALADSYLISHTQLQVCPNAVCGAVVLCDGDQSPSPASSKSESAAHRFTRCPLCAHEVCASEACAQPAHDPMPCTVVDWWRTEDGFFESLSQEDQMTKRYLVMSTKPCPKCKIPTQKLTGCKHMTCANCKEEWCWICFKHITSMSQGDGPNRCQCESQPDGSSQPVDLEQLLRASTEAMPLPDMSSSIKAQALSPKDAFTSTNAGDRDRLFVQVNKHVCQHLATRDMALKVQKRCLVALQASAAAAPRSAASLGAEQVALLQNIGQASAVLAEASKILLRALICEFYSPFLECTMLVPCGDSSAGVSLRHSFAAPNPQVLHMFVFLSRDLSSEAAKMQATIELVARNLAPKKVASIPSMAASLKRRVDTFLRVFGRAFSVGVALPPKIAEIERAKQTHAAEQARAAQAAAAALAASAIGMG